MQSVSPLLRVSLSLLLLTAAASAASLRRPRTGFLGMRGKRSAPPLELQLPSAVLADQLPGQQQLHVQMPLPHQLRQLFRAARLHHRRLVGRLADKRAPRGFAGLRGRKREDGEKARGPQGPLDDLVGKRVPSGFGGLRGKRAEMLENAEEKRTPQNSFFGLRGRRGEQP